MLIPDSFFLYCEEKGWKIVPTWLSIGLIAAILTTGANIAPPYFLHGYELAWSEWGWTHGLGGEGLSFLHLLLWQMIWLPNYVLLKLRRKPAHFFPGTKIKSE